VAKSTALSSHVPPEYARIHLLDLARVGREQAVIDEHGHPWRGTVTRETYWQKFAGKAYLSWKAD
jgi:hypothetical protein